MLRLPWLITVLGLEATWVDHFSWCFHYDPRVAAWLGWAGYGDNETSVITVGETVRPHQPSTSPAPAQLQLSPICRFPAGPRTRSLVPGPWDAVREYTAGGHKETRDTWHTVTRRQLRHDHNHTTLSRSLTDVIIIVHGFINYHLCLVKDVTVTECWVMMFEWSRPTLSWCFSLSWW